MTRHYHPKVTVTPSALTKAHYYRWLMHRSHKECYHSQYLLLVQRLLHLTNVRLPFHHWRDSRRSFGLPHLWQLSCKQPEWPTTKVMAKRVQHDSNPYSITKPTNSNANSLHVGSLLYHITLALQL